MKIHVNTLKAWAALKPHPSLPAKLKLAFRRFAPVTINGVKVAVPAKAAVKWARSAGVDALYFMPGPQGKPVLYGAQGTSAVRMPCPVEMVPLEKPYNERETPQGGTGRGCSDFDHISKLLIA